MAALQADAVGGLIVRPDRLRCCTYRRTRPPSFQAVVGVGKAGSARVTTSAHTDKLSRPSIPPRRSSSSATVSGFFHQLVSLCSLPLASLAFEETVMIQTYRKHDDDLAFAFNYDSQVEPHFKPLERFVDEDVLDLICRYEACSGGG